MKSIKLHKRTKRNTKNHKRNSKGTFKKLRNTRKNKILKGGDPDYLPLYELNLKKEIINHNLGIGNVLHE